MFLSTCNRVEVFARPKTPTSIARARSKRSTKCSPIRRRSANPICDRSHTKKKAEEAVRHVFRVTASLRDSMVLGEPQILGQVKAHTTQQSRRGSMRSFLARCVHRAFTVAKRVRSETAIGAGTVSISSVAVELSRRVFGELDDRTVLLLGASGMAEAAARSVGKGAKIRVVNRSLRSAQKRSSFGGAASNLAALERRASFSRTSSSRAPRSPDLLHRHARSREARDACAPRTRAPLRRHRRSAKRRAHRSRERQRVRVRHRQISNNKSRSASPRERRTVVRRKNRRTSAAVPRVGARSRRAARDRRAARKDARRFGRRARAKPPRPPQTFARRRSRVAPAKWVESATNKLLHGADDALATRRGRRRCASARGHDQELFELPEVPADAEDDAGDSEDHLVQ